MPEKLEKTAELEKPEKAGKRRSAAVPLAVVALALLALLLTTLGSFGAGGDDGDVRAEETSPVGSTDPGAEPQNKAPDETWEKLVRREADDPMALGDVDAPVVMLAYSEFQCPFCGKFARDTEPVLIEKYVDEGLLRIEWRDFPYLGPESTTAAQGGRAAGEQGKFWEYEEAIYADQLPPNSGKLDEDYLAGIADDLGLDVEQFRSDLTSQATQDAIAADFGEGQAIGVTGTPAFVINGVPVIGAQPTKVFESTIERAVEDAS